VTQDDVAGIESDARGPRRQVRLRILDHDPRIDHRWLHPVIPGRTLATQ